MVEAPPPDVIPGDSPLASQVQPLPDPAAPAPALAATNPFAAVPGIPTPPEQPDLAVENPFAGEPITENPVTPPNVMAPDVIPGDSPLAQQVQPIGPDVIPGDSPLAMEVVRKSDELAGMSRRQIIDQYYADGTPADRADYENAYIKVAQEGHILGDPHKTLPSDVANVSTTSPPSDSLGIPGLKTVLDIGESMLTGLITHANALGGVFTGVDYLRWQNGERRAIALTPEENVQNAAEVSAGAELAFIRGANTIRQFSVNVANAYTRGAGDSTDKAAFRDQFNFDIDLHRVEQRVGTGQSAFRRPGAFGVLSDPHTVDRQTVENLSMSPFADPSQFVPGMVASKLARVGALEQAAARAMTVVATGAAETKASAVARGMANIVDGMAKATRASGAVVARTPALTKGVTAASVVKHLTGDSSLSTVIAMLAGDSAKSGAVEGLFGKVATGLENTAAKWRVPVPPGPMSRFSASLYRGATKEAKDLMMSQAYNLPFALGTEDEEDFVHALETGVVAHAMFSVPGRLNNLSPIANFWRVGDRSPTERAPVSGGETFSDLNAAHHDVMKIANNAGNNLVQAARNLLRKVGNGTGNIYLGRPEALKQGLLTMQEQGHKFFDPDGNQFTMTPEQADVIVSHGEGATVMVEPPPAKPGEAPVRHAVGIVPFSERAPAVSLGHELWHVVEHSVLSPEERAHFEKETIRIYGGKDSVEFQNARLDYARKLGVDPATLSDSRVASELMGENFSGRINAIPVGSFGPNGEMTFKNPAYRKYVGAVASLHERVLNALGGKVPEAVVEVTKRDSEGRPYKEWVGAGKDGKATGLGWEASSQLGHIIDNFLESKRLDTHVAEAQGQPDPFTETETPAENANSPISNVREVAPAPAFKVGDPIGTIRGEDGTIVATGASITKVIKAEDGAHSYEIEYVDPEDGKTKRGVVPESILQSETPNSGEGKPAAATPAATKPVAKAPVPALTPEAAAIVAAVDAGGAAPAFISKNLERIARENGVEIINSMTPMDVVDALRAKQAAPVAETPSPTTATTPNARQVTPTERARLGTLVQSPLAPEPKKADDETLAHNVQVVQQEVARPAAEQRLLRTNYYSASEGRESDTGPVREARRKFVEAADPKVVKNLRATYEKLIHIYKFEPNPKNGRPFVTAFSFDNFIANAKLLDGWMRENPHSPSAAYALDYMQSPQFVVDVQNYWRNQANGYRGDGQPLVRPSDLLPGTVPEPTPGYKPQPVSMQSVAVLNLLMGIELPRNSSVASRFAAKMARENGLHPTENAAGVEVTNPLTALLNRDGFDQNLLHSTVQQLSLDKLSSKLEPSDLKGTSRAVLATTRAGFMPKAGKEITPPNEPTLFEDLKMGRYWLSPNGDFHEIPAGQDSTHDSWAQQATGVAGDTHFAASDELYQKGWARVSGAWSAGEVLSNNPSRPLTNAQTRALQDYAVQIGAEKATFDNGDREKVIYNQNDEGGRATYMPKTNDLGLYSNIEKSLEDWQPKGTPAQLLAHLAKTGGTKEEMAATGFGKWLEGKTGPVTREEAVKFIQDHAVDIRQVTKREPDPETLLRVNDEETIYQDDGEKHYDVVDPRNGRVAFTGDHASAVDYATRYILQRSDSAGPRYSDYVLPGGENYRENLVTLHNKEADALQAERVKLTEASREAYAEAQAAISDTRDARQAVLDHYGARFADDLPYSGRDGAFGGPGPEWNTVEMDKHTRALWETWEHTRERSDAAIKARQQADEKAEAKFAELPEPYRSSHFDEDNLLAHTRTTDRVSLPTPEQHADLLERARQAVGASKASSLASGAPEVAVDKGMMTEREAALLSRRQGWRNKYYPKIDAPDTLFMEEAQSDMHQQGRKSGYISKEEKLQNRKEISDKYKEIAQLDEGIRSLIKFTHTDPTGELPATVKAQADAERMSKERTQLYAQIKALERANEGVPDAPYKTGWPKLLLKRLIRTAAEEGKDRIAWTTGEQQAERYDLSKQISRIELQSPRPDHPDQPNYLAAYDHEGRRVIDTMVGTDPSNIEDYIGKEMTKKLIEQPWEPYKAENSRGSTITQSSKSLSGLDLKVGGEGMKGFYDQILPKVANDLGKKYGTKVSTVAIGTGGGDPAVVHTMEITPKMKEDALNGQAQFMPAVPDTPEMRKFFGDSKVVDEDGAPKVVYHGTNQDIDTFGKKGDQFGHYFTDSPDYASHFAEQAAKFPHLGSLLGGEGVPAGERTGQNVIPAILRIENPADFRSAGTQDISSTEVLRKLSPETTLKLGKLPPQPFWKWLRDYPEILMPLAEKAGHDGFIFHESNPDTEVDPGTAYYIFDKKQAKSATGNRGTFDRTRANITFMPKPAETKEFKKWFGKSEVRDEEGNPLRLFHGTTGDFTEFRPERANPEADMGAGFYFTNNPDDASYNYHLEGPDPQGKIENLADRMTGEENPDTGQEYTAEEARTEAQRRLGVRHGGATMPAFLKMEKPVKLGGDEPTYFDGDPETESGQVFEFTQALRQLVDDHGGRGDIVAGDIYDRYMDGGRADEIVKTAKESEGMFDVQDDSGNLVSGDMIRQAFEQMGFDGIIDHTVHEKWGRKMTKWGPSGMEHVHPDTTHYIVFEPTQIKSASGNRGTFDPKNPNITFMPKISAAEQDVLTSREFRAMSRGLSGTELDKLRTNTAKEMVDVFGQLPHDEEFIAAARAGLVKKGWYERAAKTIRTIFGEDAPRFVGLLAATSPRQSVLANLQMTLAIWADWEAAGRPVDEKSVKKIVEQHAQLHARVPNSIKALRGENLVDEPGLSGYKVESFRRNLLGDMQAVTNDSWMAQFGNIDQALFGTKAGYLAYTAKVRQVAKKLDMTPAEVQETVWSFFKSLKEGTSVKRSSKETLRALSDSDILNTPEFHDQIIQDPKVRAQLERLGFRGFDQLVTAADSTRAVPRAGSLAEVGREEGGPRRLRVLDRIAERAQRLHDAEFGTQGPARSAKSGLAAVPAPGE